MGKNTDGTINIDKYRTLVSSPYNVFNSKVSGKLLLIAELMTIDNFNVSMDVEIKTTTTEPTTKTYTITANMDYES